MEEEEEEQRPGRFEGKGENDEANDWRKKRQRRTEDKAPLASDRWGQDDRVARTRTNGRGEAAMDGGGVVTTRRQEGKEEEQKRRVEKEGGGREGGYS
uniref:Uncharacterized protein n=1 Tax=Caenorhabditis tropicalis TaxID=1561998 RepID=A0A1I7U7M0_9PELO